MVLKQNPKRIGRADISDLNEDPREMVRGGWFEVKGSFFFFHFSIFFFFSFMIGWTVGLGSLSPFCIVRTIGLFHPQHEN